MTDSLPTPDNAALAIAREIARLRVASDDQARASQANRRSVELNGNNGVNYYRDGDLVGGLGTTEHGDLVFFRDPVYSPIPPTPIAPSVEGIIGGISIVWDGVFTDGSQWNDGIAAVNIHAVQNINDPISELTQIHTFPTKAGGAFYYAVEPSVGELYFILESISVAGNSAQGPASAGATSISPVDQEQWQEHEDALENLNTVVLPALDAQLDANTTAINNLNTVTLPALQGDLDAAEAAVAARARVIFQTAQPTGLTAADRVIWYDTDNGYSASYWNGATWAPYSLGAGALAADSVTALQIAANSITAVKIQADAVIAAKIQAGAVVAGKIAADAVTAVTIAADAVTAVKIQAGAIIAGKIAADAVTATTIAAGAVIAGKIAAGAVTATTIAAGAVTAVKIAAGAITAGKIAAGSVTATELNSEVLKAGFVLTGSIQVGNITITASGGIIVPQTGGGSIRLPADGSSALFDGNITARSITVVNNLTLLGGNNTIAGQLTLSAGVTAPSVGPSMYRTWPSVYGETLDGSDSPWRDHIGMAQHPSNAAWFATAIIFGGTAIRYVNESTGALAQIPDPTNGQAWCAGFYAWGGIGFFNGSYYLYGQDSNRDNAWFIYRINATTMAKISDVLVTTDEYYHVDGYPTMTCGTDGNVHIFYSQGVNGRHRWYSAALGFLNDVVYNNYGIPVNHDAAYMGNADMGSAYWFLAINEIKQLVAFNASNVFDAANSFGYAEGTPLRGIMFDNTTARFKSFDKNGMLYSYSSHKTDQIVTATNTWYDAVGTTRETTPSPAVQFTIPARSHLVVETAVPPDSGNTDAGLVDKANQTKVYVGVGAGGTRRLQGTNLGVDGSGVSNRTIQLDAINTGSATAPAVNGFAAVAATGSLVSAAQSGGIPVLTIAGNGLINNQLIEDTGWINMTLVNGWTNAGSPSAVARYRRRNGVVYLEGTIVPGTNGSATGCFTLPVGFRPAAELRKTGDTNSTSHAAGRFDIQAGGVIKPQGAVTWLDISTSFLAA